MHVEVICIHDKAFEALVDRLVSYVKQHHGTKQDKWISGDEVMQKLRIKSPTTLQKLRDEDKIIYTTGTPTILYDVDSVNAYLLKQSQKPF